MSKPLTYWQRWAVEALAFLDDHAIDCPEEREILRWHAEHGCEPRWSLQAFVARTWDAIAEEVE